MGVGTIVVTLIASMQPEFSRRSWLGKSIWMGSSLVLGFAAYQSSTLLVNQWVEMHGLTANVLLRMFVRDGIWAIALFALHTVFVLNYQRLFPRLSR